MDCIQGFASGTNVLLSQLKDLRTLYSAFRHGSKTARECPVCGYVGRFGMFGLPPRADALCLRCGSLERHRLFALGLRNCFSFSGTERVLHFAPEACISKLINASAGEYITADYVPGRAALTLDIEKIDLPDRSVDIAVANHVLEHVDDRPALRELHRVLCENGRLILSVPLIAGWATTYENQAIVARSAREKHFGQSDHVRRYGRDFRERVASAGFRVDEFTSDGATTVQYSLMPGECIFVCTKI